MVELDFNLMVFSMFLLQGKGVMSLWLVMSALLTLVLPLYIMSGGMMDLLSSNLCWLTLGSMIVIWLANKSKSMKGLLVQNLMVFSLLMSFMSYHLISFYFWFEFSLIPMLVMLLLWGGNPERLSATLYFLFYTSAVSIPYFVIVMKLSDLYLYSFMKVSISMSFLLLLLLPFFIKLPLFGVHFWLPKAHVEASTSSSMLLAGLLLKLGSYGVIRLSYLMLTFAVSASMTILMLSFIASALTIIQSDIKKLIAYSSVSHMSFIIMSIMFYNNLSYKVIILGSVTHGWISMCMFFVAGSISSTKMTRMLFLYSASMWLGLMFGLSLMANAAVPPHLSFVVELYLIINSLMSSILSLIPIVFMSLCVCYYSVYLFLIVMHGQSINSLKHLYIKEIMMINIMLLFSLTSLWLL